MASKATTSSNAPAKPRTPPRRHAAAAPAKPSRRTGAILGAAAAGIAAGLFANIGRKALVQAPSALAGDWFDALKAEHKMALGLFDAIQATTDDQTARRNIFLTQLKHALAKHAFTEENVVYPALRESGDVANADELNKEHGYVKQYLYELDNIEKSSPRFLAKVAEFRRDLEEHIADEEHRIFPALHAKLGEKNKAVTLAANREGFKIA